MEISDWEVVLVDDEPDSLKLLQDVLELNGAYVHHTTDGVACLTLLGLVTPTVVIVDLAMPHPDGWEILSAIRANPEMANVPVVAVTAYHSREVQGEALRYGFDGFLSKPVRAREFLEELKQIVG